MTFIGKVVCAIVTMASCSVAVAQGYTLRVVYDRPGLQIPHWQMDVDAAGGGTYVYTSEKVPGQAPLTFTVSPVGLEKIGKMLEKSRGLKPCETKNKGVANMGMKTLTYTPAGGTALTCTFNYTENRGLSDLADYVFATVSTLQAGVELERLHRYDKLGMDPVMLRLVSDAKSGHAVEMGAIRPLLQSLIDDPSVLERVRSRAQDLLASAGTP